MDRNEFYTAIYSACLNFAGKDFDKLNTGSLDQVIDKLYEDIGQDKNLPDRIDNFARGIVTTLRQAAQEKEELAHRSFRLLR